MNLNPDYIKGLPKGIDFGFLKSDFIYNFHLFLVSQGVPQARSEAIAGSVFSLMADTDLRYHTPVHILTIFQWADQNKITLKPWEELAIWFHDAIYVPDKKDNEVRSGQLLRAMLGNQECLNDIIDYAHAGILATANHEEDPGKDKGDQDKREFDLLMDLDLCMFAWPYPEYKAASDLVAAELVPVYGQEKYKQGRRDFLSRFFHRSSIFRTEYFLEHHELHAKTNILKTLSES